MTTEPTTTTTATVAAPSAQLTSWTETIVITVTDAPPFDLPTLGYFSGYGELPAPGEVLKPGDLTPYAFTVGRVEIEIDSSEILDYAAFPAGGTASWRGVDDHSEDHRPVATRGVHRKHWPEWLGTLVDDTLGGNDPRAKVPVECTNCGSDQLSWGLQLADVGVVFALGCDECPETVATLSAAEVAAAMNIAHRPLREQ
jgi:hypothetical protein